MVKKEGASPFNQPFTTGSPGEPMSVDVKVESDIKSEAAAEPAQESMALDGVQEPRRSLRTKKSTSSSPPLDEGANSKKPSTSPATMPSTTPAPPTNTRKPSALQVQLIPDLPIAREEALKTFNEIQANNYQNKSIGKSKEMFESMTCDCVYEHGLNDPDDACGPYSDCINRLTQVECLADDCRCSHYCQNQRFQGRQYANIEIVLTELKGYGLRAEENIPKDAFIYEYVGDVVSPPVFKKRMRDYALEGIQHFYFMMLQKDEFIDATKSGGIGRFANHSCNPNCYVAKWTVGDHVRMGIFSKRDIQRHEELTFNYNVDRYGHQAQTCYCGEPNCVGFIGGKTQSDFVTMDDLYLDALGITDEDDVAELKGSKKKKGKKIDDVDFMPVAKPVVEKEVPKLIQAIRQTQSKKVMMNLLNRLKITEDQPALIQLMRLRGYSVMKIVLDEYAEDLPISESVLQCLKRWPLLNRNKVYDSTINVSVEALLGKHESESFKTLAQELLDHWSNLPLYKRIAKVAYNPDTMPVAPTMDAEQQIPDEEERKQKDAERWEQLRLAAKKNRPGWLHDDRPLKKARLEEAERFSLILLQRRAAVKHVEKRTQEKLSVKEIIAKAEADAKAEEERKAAEATEAAAKAKARQERIEKWEKKKAEKAEKEDKKKKKAPALSAEEKEKLKEKRLLKLIGAVVVKCMTKYAKGLSKEMFKKYAKELTGLIAEKEKKSSSYKDDKLESLSDEKVAKIKKFSKDFITKLLRKLGDKGLLNSGNGRGRSNGSHRPSSSSMTPTNATASSSTHTPNSAEGVGDASVGGEMSMSVEEAMDMDPDSDHDDELDAEGELDDEHPDQETFTTAGDFATDKLLYPMQPLPVEHDDDGMNFAGGGGMYLDPSESSWQETVDPRRRPTD